MEDSPLSPGSALEASPPAEKPEFSLALVDCTHEGSTIKLLKELMKIDFQLIMFQLNVCNVEMNHSNLY